MRKLITILLLTAALGCHKDKVEPATGDCVEKTTPSGPCYEIYDPVCGCNNKTYSNSCFAESVGIMKYTKGACGTGK